MSVTDSVLKTIDYAIDMKTKKLLNTDEMGIVNRVNTDGTYNVLIQGEYYDVPNGSGIPFKSGSLVWVHSPNGNFNKKYIIASRVSVTKSFSNENEGDSGGSGMISPSDLCTNADIDGMFV